jgi:hypothetical protein
LQNLYDDENPPSVTTNGEALLLHAHHYHVQFLVLKGNSKQRGTPSDTAIDDSRADSPENHVVYDP